MKTSKNKLKYVFGPVYSWRLGYSLGIDLTYSKRKVCNFNCIYCQLGRTVRYTDKRSIFVPTKDIIRELKLITDVKTDYITLSGCGEPTLAKNLGAVIESIKKIRKEPVAVITNSYLICCKDVQRDLMKADKILFKLDGCSDEILKKVNNPVHYITFENMFQCLKKFRKAYKGHFALQIMFVKENKKCAGELAKLAAEIGADEIQINTPTRQNESKPLSRIEINKIKSYFYGRKIISVYDKPYKDTVARGYGNIKKRHPN
ncbi:MAG: radical SAM protein [bacterium]